MNKIFESKNLLLCGIFFLIFKAALGQSTHLNLNVAIKNIGRNGGLGDNHINNTFIDSKDRIWFLSHNKIYSFNSAYVSNHEFTQSFSNKGFNFATEDSRGNFWLTENLEWFYPFNIHRCVVYYPKTQKTLPFEKYVNKNLNLHSVIADPTGKVFLSSKNGEIYRFEASNKQLTKIISLGESPIKILIAERDRLIVVIEKTPKFDAKILEISPSGQILHQENVDKKLIRSILKNGEKTYFTYQENQYIGISEIGGNLKKRFLVSKEAYLGNISFNHKKNLFVVNKGNEVEFLNEKLESIKNQKFDFLIHHMAHDRQGNTFLSTNNGVYILRLVEQRIKTFLQNPFPEKTNDNYSCRAILKFSNRNLIVNTNRKRQLIDLKTNEIKSIEQKLDSDSPDNKFILSILRDSDNQLLFGEDVLLQTNLKSGKNTILRKLDSTKIWSMENYRHGILLGLEKKGIVFYDSKNNAATNFIINDINLKNSIIYDFQTINQNKVLIASEAGLYLLINNKNFVKIPVANNENNITFFSITPNDQNTDIYFLASSMGIWTYNLASNAVRPFIQDYSYQQKKFLSAYQTQNGVWASSEEGVWHFNDHGVLLKIFTTKDGLSSNECNRLAHYKDEKGILYFGGVNGLNIIDPMDYSNQVEPKFPLRISSLTTYSNQVKHRTNLSLTGQYLELERNENSLTVELNYEDFKYDCNKKYFYRSNKSIRKDWVPISGNTLNLDYVARGLTEVEIKVVSCDDFIDSPIIKFIVKRPKQIYLEWYFLPGILLALGLLFWAFNKYSTYKLRLRNESLQRKIARQTQSLQESLTLKETLLSLLVHDVRYPVQSFYDLSKKLAYLTKKNDTERLKLLGKETEDKSRKVLWLIDELVYWVKSTNDKNEIIIQSKNIGEQIEQILDIYSDEIAQKNLSFSKINLHHSITSDYGLLIIVLRNLIYNSIIHSEPSSNIEITLEKGNGKFILKIINQSVSNSRTLEGGLGIGLALLHPLLEKSNITLKTNAVESIFTAELEIY